VVGAKCAWNLEIKIGDYLSRNNCPKWLKLIDNEQLTIKNEKLKVKNFPFIKSRKQKALRKSKLLCFFSFLRVSVYA